MVNRNYRNGADKERKIVKFFREKGCLAFRSAGSHSPIDVFVLDFVNKRIKLIQSKSGKSYSESFKKKLMEELKIYEGTYSVSVSVE